MQAEKGTIMKAVGVVEATPETLFELIMSLDNALRYQLILHVILVGYLKERSSVDAK